MALVKIEGSDLDLDDSICKTDKGLKDALAPFYPAVANADIKRETKGEQMVITVTKRAGSKGCAEVVNALDAAPETICTVLLLALRGSHKAEMQEVDQVILDALEAEQSVQRTLNTLDEAAPQAMDAVPVGF